MPFDWNEDKAHAVADPVITSPATSGHWDHQRIR
jgi:hypothetical protein